MDLSADRFRSDALRTLAARGFLNQVTDAEGLDRLFLAGPVTAYIGFDATADSLHVGSLLQIMALRWLQKTGNRPLALMGGGTTRIGDPSGKDESRRLLSDADIQANIAGIARAFAPLLLFGEGRTDAKLVDNDTWLSGLAYIPLLREVGRHFTVNRMLTFDSVRLRLEREQPLTFLEFNYMILQAYDFVELARREGCRLQMGGSDQWGNIVCGIDLGRRLLEVELFGATIPLMTTAAGTKMGKTADGAVWLNADRLAPYAYWQFWRNAADADVGRFLRLYTDLPLDEIARLEALGGSEINEAKKRLANEATALMHGAEAAAAAAETARQAFEEGAAAEGLPEVTVTQSELAGGLALIDLAVRLGLAPTKGEARRLVRGGGLRLNDRPVADEAALLAAQDLADGPARLTAGKKRHGLIRTI